MDDRTQLVDARELFVRSRRFDLIFKFELAKAWAFGTASEIRIAEEAYLEHIRAHNGFCEKAPLRLHPFEFIRDAFETTRSILRKGYDVNCPPIPVSGSGELLGGAHRLAACVAYNCRCAVRCIPSAVVHCGNSFSSYRAGDIHPAVMNWGVRAYMRGFPDGCLLSEFAQSTCFEDREFPDWRHRAGEFRGLSLSDRIKKTYYSATLPFRFGERRQKAQWKIVKITRRSRSMEDMAWAVEHRWRIDGDEIRFSPIQ